MLGRFVKETKAGSVIFTITEKDGAYHLEIDITTFPIAIPASRAEVRGNSLVIESTFIVRPGYVAVMQMEWDGSGYNLSGEHILLGELSGKAVPFTGKTKKDIMAEELPLKRTGKKVMRTRQEIAKETEAILEKMTLEEKVGQMFQSVGDFSAAIGADVKNTLSEDERIRRGMIGALNGMSPLHISYEKQKIAVEESRLGIPLLFCQDVIHGKHTIFPIPLAWACSFDPGLVEKAVRISAEEATAAGIMYTMGPMVDIARDPRWGRVSEGAGEDPYLGQVMSVAQVHGYQGDSLYDENTMMATLKHFIGYGAAEGGRDYNTCEISETTLRNVYLPPFREGIRAGAASIMNSFNVINGVPMAINKKILKDLLRDELGFEGIVISDFGSIDECLAHGAAEDIADAAAKALNASLDIEMATKAYQENLGALVESGRVSEAMIDEAVRRILRYKFESGLMDDPYKYFRPEDDEKAFNDDYLTVSRKLARESAVLLKNNGVLPLGKDKKIALVGPQGDSVDLLGPWQFSSRISETVTIKQGLENAGYSVTYAKGCEIQAPIESGIKDAKQAAANADVIILALGEDSAMSGEAASRLNITIPEPQMELAEAMKVLNKPLILLLTNGRPLLLNWFEDNTEAILESWFLGSQAGNALADIISGTYNPSGKLSITFPRHAGQIPLYYNYLNTGRPYKEGDTNKFLSKYLDGQNTPLYPFGYGLNYTKFTLSDMTLSQDRMDKDGQITAGIKIQNTGNCQGTEVVQLYLRDAAASITRPVKELKGFRRVELKPGESSVVTFEITEPMLRFFNVDGMEVSEPGRFDVMIGTSSRDEDEQMQSFVLV